MTTNRAKAVQASPQGPLVGNAKRQAARRLTFNRMREALLAIIKADTLEDAHRLAVAGVGLRVAILAAPDPMHGFVATGFAEDGEPVAYANKAYPLTIVQGGSLWYVRLDGTEKRFQNAKCQAYKFTKVRLAVAFVMRNLDQLGSSSKK